MTKPTLADVLLQNLLLNQLINQIERANVDEFGFVGDQSIATLINEFRKDNP